MTPHLIVTELSGIALLLFLAFGRVAFWRGFRRLQDRETFQMSTAVPSGESSEPHVRSRMWCGALWQMRGSSSVFVGLGLALGKALPLVQG